MAGNAASAAIGRATKTDNDEQWIDIIRQIAKYRTGQTCPEGRFAFDASRGFSDPCVISREKGPSNFIPEKNNPQPTMCLAGRVPAVQPMMCPWAAGRGGDGPWDTGLTEGSGPGAAHRDSGQKAGSPDPAPPASTHHLAFSKGTACTDRPVRAPGPQRAVQPKRLLLLATEELVKVL
jgi:hypothetical protein